MAKAKETWFVRYRQEWIAEMFEIFGSLRREHITKKFGVSIQQASIDLSRYQRANPRAIQYDSSAKIYKVKS